MRYAAVPDAPARVAPKELFRARFQRALRNCVRRRFSVAECFGVIWLETLEEISLPDDQQADLYDELIHWAKHRLFADVIYARAAIAPESLRPNSRVSS